MKTVCVVPGSGGRFYCQNCLRDLVLVRALRAAGADVTLVPLYLPLLGGGDGGDAPVFFGALNLYLAERWPAFRRAPGWLHRLLDHPALLRAAARRAGSTDPAGLEEMTLSMLRGERGRQRGQLDELVRWMAEEVRPDVVHLSNALLLGLAAPLRRALGAAVVCSLQDENVWMDAMRPDAARAVWAALAEAAAGADVFLAASRHYADRMIERLRLDPDRVRVVYPGVDPAAYPAARPDPASPVIGFLSREAEGLGLARLVEAFLRLRREPRFTPLRLHVAGGRLGEDRAYVRRLRARLRRAGAADAVAFDSALDPPGRAAFLRQLTLLCVPARRETAFGLYLVEAMAAGVPFVQPRAGAFPEIAEASGAGVICEGSDPAALAAALAALLDDPARRAALAAAGRAAAAGRFSARRMAADTLDAYETAAARGGAENTA